MLVRRDQKQDAVVLLRLAELPLAEQRVGVRLDLLAAERGDAGDDELDARLRFQRRQLGLERGPLIGRQDIGGVDDAPAQRRKARRGREGACRREQQRQQRNEGAKSADRSQNFTFGAAAAPVSAVNSTIGLLPLKAVDAQITVGNVRSAVL
jgi:hypothetical protein